MKKPLAILVFLSLSISITSAQVAVDNAECSVTLPEVALVDIEPYAGELELSLETTGEAGDAPVFAGPQSINYSSWLNYSSSLAPNATSRSISVQVTNGTIPPGLELRLLAAPPSGSGGGARGYPAGIVVLGNTSKLLVNGIGGCYTGNGPSNGHRLTYTLAVNSIGALDADKSSTIEVTFTITD